MNKLIWIEFSLCEEGEILLKCNVLSKWKIYTNKLIQRKNIYRMMNFKQKFLLNKYFWYWWCCDKTKKGVQERKKQIKIYFISHYYFKSFLFCFPKYNHLPSWFFFFYILRDVHIMHFSNKFNALFVVVRLIIEIDKWVNGRIFRNLWKGNEIGLGLNII